MVDTMDVLMQAEYCSNMKSRRVWDKYYVALMKTVKEMPRDVDRSIFNWKKDGKFEDVVLPRVEAMVDALCKGQLLVAEMNAIAAFYGNDDEDAYDVRYGKRGTELAATWSEFIADMANNPRIRDLFVQNVSTSVGARVTPSRFFNTIYQAVTNNKTEMVDGKIFGKNEVETQRTVDDRNSLQALRNMEWKGPLDYLDKLLKFGESRTRGSGVDQAFKEVMNQ